MTSSDDLRGDPGRSQKDRIDYSDLQEFTTLRALLRPRMDATGETSSTEALRGMFIEIEHLHSQLTAAGRIREPASASNPRNLEYLAQHLSPELADVITEGAQISKETLRIATNMAERERHRATEARLRDTLNLYKVDIRRHLNMVDDASDGAVAERLITLVSREGRRRTTDEAIIADNENAIAKLTSELAAERKLAIAAAEGHDHVRGILLAIAAVFGRVDDLDSLPDLVANVRSETERDLKVSLAAAEQRLDEANTAAARWTKICEAFGFDPASDPPAPPPDFKLPSLARCPVCHCMAPVKEGRFEYHLSGDRPCSGTAPTGRPGDPFDLQLKALIHLGWVPETNPYAWATERRAKVVELEAQALDKDNAASELSGLREALDEAAGLARERRAALAHLGWSDTAGHPMAWAEDKALTIRALREQVTVLEAQLKVGDRDVTEIEAVREALGVPAGKPLLPYVRHAAKGMQALAIIGWRDGHPVEWATKRAAAEADLRGAFAEAELVGDDHAAMVRQLGGNLRRMSASVTKLAAAEHRIQVFRGWVLGMTPAGTSTAARDDELIRAVQFVPRADFDEQRVIADSLARECAHLRSLIEVMADIKRRLNALPSLSP